MTLHGIHDLWNESLLGNPIHVQFSIKDWTVEGIAMLSTGMVAACWH